MLRIYFSCVFLVLRWNLFVSFARGMDLNFSTLSGITTTQIGDFEDNVASRAIDEIQNYDIDHCECCSVALNPNKQHWTWWQIDLGQQYLIDSVILFGRSDGNEAVQIQGANLFAGNVSLSADTNSGQMIFTVSTSSILPYRFEHHLSSAVIARYFIVRLNYRILTLCEFQLATKDCDRGFYGNGCSHVCHCREDHACDPVNGHCKAGHCDSSVDIDSCYTYDNVVKRLNASAYQSKDWSTCTADRAIDGKDSPAGTTEANLCEACSVAQSDTLHPKASWTLDLGQAVLVAHIRIIGRSEHLEQVNNMACYISVMDFNNATSSEQLPFNSLVGNVFNITLDPPRLFRYLKLERDNLLSLCEVKLLEGACTGVGSFGDKCAKSCHCSDNLPCNTVNGHCTRSGCKEGWRGEACNLHCNPGFYGNDCLQKCHCYNDDACNPVTGHCKAGHCDPRADVDVCYTYDNVVKRLNASASQSKDWSTCTADRAIDGKDSPAGTTDADLCQSCSVAQNDTLHPKASWTLDLGQAVVVAHIRIIGRSGYTSQVNNMRCFISVTGFSAATNSEELPFNSSAGNVFNIPLNPPRVFRYLKLERDDILSLCEVKILEGACMGVGSYGDKCAESCHCSDNLPCDTVNGRCKRSGCKEGWRGEACNLPCELGSYGYNCTSKCHCIDHSSCNNVNGTCDLSQCAPGWLEHNCSIPCELGSYGINCTSKCHCINHSSCNNVNGTCDLSQCDPGWLGHNCSIPCELGSYGINCSSKCHCINHSPCNNVDGICDVNQCDPGWLGHNCSIPCELGSFGINCTSKCHCINHSSCNNVNGTCDLSQCDPGWLGHNCSIPCALGNYGDNCTSKCHCINQSSCNNVNGTCDVKQCDAGWLGHNCSIQCPSRSFGFACNQTCHCNNSDCNPISGVCDEMLCEPGWNGSSCNQACKDNKFGENCSTICHCKEGSCHHINGTCTKSGCATGWQGESCALQISSQESSAIAGVAGGLSAVVIVVAVAVVVGFFLYRRHKSKSADQRGTKTFTHLDEALKQKQQRRAEINASRKVSGNVNSAYTETNLDEDKNVKDDGYAGDGGGYYDFTEVVGIRIHELWDYIQEKKSNECEKLFEEFKKLPSGLIHPCTSADQLVNRGKNRYREMYAYDRNRVVLEEKNDKGTDYVNASYIDGYNKTKKFVACQGPTKQMIEDFWRMVWQLKSDKIVMLTNLIEQGATKCTLYWPKEEEFSYGKVNVKIVKLDTDLDFDIRHLDVWKEGESPRRIRQYHFKSWPDKDVPDSTWCLVKFWRAVQTDAESKAGPIIVHCSAGVGRTGTFIALDNLVHQGRDEGCVRPFQIVQALREQRVNMVQTKEQYVYLHEVLADTLSFGTQFVWSTQFEAVYMSLLQKDDGESKIRLEVQYDLIKKSLKNTESKEAEAPEYSNMETIMSESDEYRPKLKKRGSKFVQQLGATFVPNYDGRNTFLVAMSPDKSTIEEFWSLVDDLNIKSVIMLTEKSSTCYKASCDLGAQNDNGGKFHVNKVEEKIRKGYTERSFTFKESHREEENHLMTVKQFEYTAWKDGYVVPGDARSLVDLLDAVLSWQSHISESQPVLIYDGDGCSRSGILCVALNEVQRIKTEGGHINIVQSVKTMKQRKPQLINNFEQYKFCYEIILAYLKHTEVYQNVK